MQCAKCGASTRPHAKFCEECGTPLALACPQCGASVLVGKKFCGDCGASLFSAPIASAQISSLSSQVQRPTREASPSLFPAADTPPHLASRIRSSKAAIEGERKVITFLFADIKGSMDILENLDPEESKRLLDPCIQLMMDAVHRAEGTVSRVLGDGIMALFGAPLALEDHPHRALYAALRMHEAVRRYAVTLQERHGISLQIRVGVNTGEVVVGAIGNDLFMEYTPVGHAVGLAARMEAHAAPGSTLVTASTYQLTQHAFRFTSRGAVQVKGAKKPLATYELIEPDPSHSRFTARTAYGLTPFLGRARECEQVKEFATQVATGRGQLVTLIGEAGVGKSRLLEELKPTLRERGFLLIEGAGFAYGKTRAYLPLIDMFKRYCGISDQDPPASYREKLRATLTGVHASLASAVPAFLDLLGVEPDDPSLAALSPEAKLQQVLNGTKRLIALQCRLQPVALLVEDLHWLDGRSVAFLHALTTGIVSLPVLFLCSSRPGHSYPWERQSFSHQLQLDPLPHDVTVSLFTALTGDALEAPPFAQPVCERSGGNPLFLEEIVQSLRETGVLAGSTPSSAPTTAPATWGLPPTIQGVLASRLDRLPPAAKSLLQTMSVIGREAPLTLLTQVADLAEAEFSHALQLLQARELVYESALYPDSVYSFKHALIQEVAYHGLLHEQRARQHERVGDAMETLYADKLPEYVSLLAYHYTRGTNTAKALHYLDLAGRRASALYADADAQYFWEEYLRLLETQPQAPERDRQEIQIRLHLISVLSRQSIDDTLVRAQFIAAEAACRRLNDAPLLATVHATLAVAYVLWGRPQGGLPHARAAKDIADALKAPRLQVITAGPLAHLLWLAGLFEEALRITEEGLALVQTHGFAQERMGFVIHPYAHCLAIAGASQGFLGKLEEGVQSLRQAAVLTEQDGNRMSQAVVHWGIALQGDLYGDRAMALQEANRALTIMEEVSPTTGVLHVGCLQEYLTASTAPSISATRGVQTDEPTTASYHKLTRTWREQRPFCELAGAWLAELAAQAGNLVEAQQLARAAVEKAETSGSRWFQCVAHLTLGRLLVAASEASDEAEAQLRTAFDLATMMRSLPLLAHAALALGECREKRGEAPRAKQYVRQALTLGEQLSIPDVIVRARHLLGAEVG
jgi:class 3 adenylate cyclase/tetratricopeptide (TPR) repeat protein